MDLSKELGKDLKKLSKETVEKGGVLALLYFDLNANSKETLQQIGAALVQKILQREGVVYAVGEIDDPISSDGLFSSSMEAKILVKNFTSLAKICADHPPFSIEVLEPEQIKFNVAQAHDLLMSIATSSYEMKKFIIEKVYTPKDLADFRKVMAARAEMGRKIMEKKR